MSRFSIILCIGASFVLAACGNSASAGNTASPSPGIARAPRGGASGQLVAGLPTFGGYLCTSTPQPAIGPTVPANLATTLRNVYYTTNPSGPPCKAQSPLGTATTGQPQAFPQLKALP